jgi:ATP-dependent helicase HrpB
MPEGPGIAALPIDPQVPALLTALQPPGSVVVLQAPPGAGKTTRVPLALLDSLADEGRILLLEPRRLAARHAALRMCQERGESLGERIGYRVRLDNRVSAATRLEVLTAGLFLRQLQDDPELTGVACVIFDEFHERSAEADLALALLRQARELVRPDLRLLVMSATLEAQPLQQQLPGSLLIRSEGRSWPVEVHHQPPRPQERLEQQVVRALEHHWLDTPQQQRSVLVFLPGRRELLACQRAIAACAWSDDCELALLHGQLELDEQSRALQPAPPGRGKIVLATAIAESSLTIEAVELVIDAGLSRRNRFDPGSGMDGLVTVAASQASAEQRRGRAGRLAPGRCLRLWSASEQQRRPAFDPPELLEVDPLPIALQLARWGSAGEDLAWLDPPPAAALAEARRLLLQLGALDDQGRITPHGRALSSLGLHPRLGHMLLRAEPRGWLQLACELAVLLSEPDPLERHLWGCDLLRRLDWLRDPASGERRRQRLRLQEQLHRQVLEARRSDRQHRARPPEADTGPHSRPALASASAATDRPPAGSGDDPEREDSRVARLLSWAFPERLALSRGRADGRFLMRNGRGALLHPQDPLSGAEALAIAAVDGQGTEARVLLAALLPRALLLERAAEQGQRLERARWDPHSQRVVGERLLSLDALELERAPWPQLEDGPAAAALLEGLRQIGLEQLPWSEASQSLRQRLQLAHVHLGEPWPDRSPAALEQTLELWLGPRLLGLRSLQELQDIDWESALWGDLAWPLRQELERLLPQRLGVPSGRTVRLDYASGEPVLAVKLQELFGCPGLPPLLDGRLPIRLHLLSPAGRPAAITRDLAGFWRQGYAEVRRELRGRYPRHPWPEDPSSAQATALTKAALARREGRSGPG